MQTGSGLNGKVVIITGGAMGMGRASAERFMKEGAKVVIVDITEEAGAETAKELHASGNRAAFVRRHRLCGRQPPRRRTRCARLGRN